MLNKKPTRIRIDYDDGSADLLEWYAWCESMIHGERDASPRFVNIPPVKMLGDFVVVDGRVRSYFTNEWWTPKELLLEVRKNILGNPKAYSQSVWNYDCGKPCCLGGWCELLTSGKTTHDNSDQALCTFLHGTPDWPWLFDAVFARRIEYSYPAATAEDGARAIDLYIEERGWA